MVATSHHPGDWGHQEHWEEEIVMMQERDREKEDGTTDWQNRAEDQMRIIVIMTRRKILQVPL